MVVPRRLVVSATTILVLWCAVFMLSAPLAEAQPAADIVGVRELAEALAAERQHIAELTVEIEQRNAALASLAARIDALEAQPKVGAAC